MELLCYPKASLKIVTPVYAFHAITAAKAPSNTCMVKLSWQEKSATPPKYKVL